MPFAIDNKLLEHASSDRASLERLIGAVWPEAYRVALGILRDRGLAEDAAQEACAALARSLPSLRSGERFTAWIHRIVVNEALTVARRNPRTHALDAVEKHGITFERSDAMDLQDALAKLPTLQRAVIILHYYAGLNSGEIARSTRLPPSTVRFHLMLARRALRKALAGIESHTILRSDEVFSDVR